jgi:hypothetical protein
MALASLPAALNMCDLHIWRKLKQEVHGKHPRTCGLLQIKIRNVILGTTEGEIQRQYLGPLPYYD